jgi:hypothetical protein
MGEKYYALFDSWGLVCFDDGSPAATEVLSGGTLPGKISRQRDPYSIVKRGGSF